MDQNQETITTYFYKLINKLEKIPDSRGYIYHPNYNISLRYNLVLNNIFFKIIFLKGATNFLIIERKKNTVVAMPLNKIQKRLRIKNIERINDSIEEYIATFS